MQKENDDRLHTVDDIMQNTLDNIKNILSVQTFVGEAIDMGNGCTIYPVIKLTIGMVSGGGEYSAKKIRKYSSYPFVGASGAGVCAQPVAFITNNKGDVCLQTIESQNFRSGVLKKLVDVISKYLEKVINNK